MAIVYASLTSEQARRELLVAPIIADVCYYTRSQLRIEYPIVVNDWLKGNLDYFVRADTTLLVLVVEAKNDDLARGFRQLGAELNCLGAMVKFGAIHSLWSRDHWRYLEI
ncbi:hypothetical protein [Thermocoleostomius sinensis]|uniref:Uncharacterized protein n=1 Tax=Thermocoleostomius sinensis A174 TaxID=2016057 RepID=A0A9E9C7Q7_9CYAN|nr:hypothetical protein [Thermocoleostomius sinensis]WAL59478.1 hypothetical protein OXH18_20235 [Thermocoleostomius sinensis A174]